MKRVFLFIVTHMAALALLSIVVFIIEQVFARRVAGGPSSALPVFAPIFAMGGACIFLARARWSAERMLGVRVLHTPQRHRLVTGAERPRLADRARIGMPKGSIFHAADLKVFATGGCHDAALVP